MWSHTRRGGSAKKRVKQEPQRTRQRQRRPPEAGGAPVHSSEYDPVRSSLEEQEVKIKALLQSLVAGPCHDYHGCGAAVRLIHIMAQQADEGRALNASTERQSLYDGPLARWRRCRG